jgi:hydrogenase expression/formation protein HypE
MGEKEILLAHGSGGKAMRQLIEEMIVPHLSNPYLDELADSAVVPVEGQPVVFTTDSYVVDPPFFPGGDIGKLAVNGTVNDLAMCGGTPLFLSLAPILEEGFSLDLLDRILASASRAAKEAGVTIVTGDTKVVGRGGADKIFITTTGIARLEKSVPVSVSRIRQGDRIIVSGTVGDHGIAVMLAREGLTFQSGLLSDTAPLNGMVAQMMARNAEIHALRDPTRGGIATTLSEIAQSRKMGITLCEEAIPVKPEVASACEILGLDPLYVANEGKLIAFTAPQDAERTLKIVRDHPYGKEAAIIGEVAGEIPGKVVLRTKVGGTRIVDMLTGDQLPRIC